MINNDLIIVVGGITLEI